MTVTRPVSARVDPPPARVLVIEDNPADARLAREWLSEGGRFDIQIATRLSEAVAILGAHPRFDAITVDLTLPDSRGLETFRRAQAAAPDTPMVIVTGLADEDAAIEAVHGGAQDYLVKDPGMSRMLPRAIHYAIERHRLLAEAKALEAAQRQAERLHALGTLAGGIAHDFNNLLTAIIGYYEILKEQLMPGTQQIADLEEIGKAARIAAMLTRQLLAFARTQPVEKSIVDINELIANFRRTLVSILGDRIDVEVAPGAGALPVEADGGQLHQLLLNLAANARDAMPDGGKFTITTLATSSADTPPRPIARVVVSDTGKGMDQQTQRRIFEPFFTTKGLGRGTGLGLAMVHGIVENSGGTITVTSEPGQGTTFIVDLPLRERETADPEVLPGSVAKPAVVLVIEDEDAIRTLVTKSLVRARFDVMVAASGSEALALAASASRAPAAIFSDVVLSDSRAQAIMPRLKERWPEAKVILTSGFSDEEQFGAVASDAFLPKPFGPSEVVAAVRQALKDRQ